jgi:ParB family chromosome partitioning protein
MSLVENLARRQHRPIELLHGIELLRKQGYDIKEIAKKTGMTLEYMRQLSVLLERGEERLLSAVESGKIPVTIAAQIATAPDGNIQKVLQEAYENNILRGHKLKLAKRLVNTRSHHGKAISAQAANSGPPKKDATLSSIRRNYEKEADRQRMVVAEGTWVREKLAFISQALADLCRDAIFNDMLRAEGLETMPRQLAEIMPTERSL